MPLRPIVTRHQRVLGRPSVAMGLVGIVLAASGSGCGQDSSVGGTIDDRPTLPSTVTEEGSNPGDEIVEPSGSAEPQTRAWLEASPVFCCNPLSVNFAAVVPDDQTSTAISYQWNLDDGSTRSGQTPLHTYSAPDTYNVSVTVAWNDGVISQHRLTVEFVADESGRIHMTTSNPDESTMGESIVTASGDVVADAGSDRRPHVGDEVILDGGGSYSTSGDELSYTWTQTAGPEVVLSDYRSVVVSFTMPDIEDVGEPLVFELIVSDGDNTAGDVVRVLLLSDTDEQEEEGEGDNNPPSAFGSTVSTSVDSPSVITLEGDDPDGDYLTFSIVDRPSHGTLDPLETAPGNFAIITYTPDDGFVGEDRFTFQVWDGTDFSSDAMVSVVVMETGGPPEAFDAHGKTFPGSPVVITLTGSDSEGQDLSFQAVNGPDHGSLGEIDNGPFDEALVTYTPQQGFVGTDSFTFLASDGVDTSQKATCTIIVNRRIIPWVEINAPTGLADEYHPGARGSEPDQTLREFCVEGLRHWAKVTDTVIVTTQAYNVQHLYPYLKDNAPENLRIIGGFKPGGLLPGCTKTGTEPYDYTYLGSIEEGMGWAYLVDRAGYVASSTGNDIVMLENEGALWRYHFSERGVDIDLEQLSARLGLFDQANIRVWTYLPTILDEPGSELRAKTTTLVSTWVDSLHEPIVVGYDRGWIDWRESPRKLANRNAMIALVGAESLYDDLLVTSDGYVHYPDYQKRCYTPEEAIEEITTLPGVNFIVYPGGNNWISVAEEFEGLLGQP